MFSAVASDEAFVALASRSLRFWSAAESAKHFEVSHLKKDAENAANLAKLEIASLKSSNEELKAQLAKISADLAAANEKVKGIAEKALESASSQRTLAEVSMLQQTRQDNGVSRKS